MYLVVFALLLISCTCDINVSIDRIKGDYNVTINNHVWLRSSRTALYVNDRWYSSNDSSLPLIDSRLIQGFDQRLGSWNETQLIYRLSYNGFISNITGRIRQWNSQPAITFHLDIGDKALNNNNNTLDKNQIRTIFPSFKIEEIDSMDNRGYFTFQGVMMGYESKHAGIWNSNSKVITNSVEGGPVVVFDLNNKGQGDTMIVSPFSQFMATSLNQQDNILQYGVMGSMETIPAGYSSGLILFYSSEGINSAINYWGRLMQRAYNRNNEYRLNDPTINYLGYYTDGGAYYYYNSEPGLNYEDTILDIYAKANLPIHYIQLDSWWYYKGIAGGVSNWTSRSDIFPDGLPTLYHRLKNTPLAAHNKFWAPDNVYSHKYVFFIDRIAELSLPAGNDSFWIDLLSEAANNWGLIMYEQDWLHVQTELFVPLLTNINLGRQWLISMGIGADKANITIQYCSAFPRHALQALEIPRVTQARSSNDYSGHILRQEAQWAIGITSLLSDALGMAPFKDVFWSTTYEPGTSYKSPTMEILPDREILISTLSTGPVSPGDGINFINNTRIMKCCRQDGLILKPDRPITMIDLLISDWAQYNGISQGELYSTQTMINEQTFYIVFASAMRRDYSIYPSHIKAQSGVVWSYKNPSTLATFDDTHSLDVVATSCNASSFCLWYISPLWQFQDANQTKFAFLGESDKWTAISRQRFTSINIDMKNSQTTISLEGSPAEIIQLSIYHSAKGVITLKCFLSPSTGQAQLVITPTTVTCFGINLGD